MDANSKNKQAYRRVTLQKYRQSGLSRRVFCEQNRIKKSGWTTGSGASGSPQHWRTRDSEGTTCDRGYPLHRKGMHGPAGTHFRHRSFQHRL